MNQCFMSMNYSLQLSYCAFGLVDEQALEHEIEVRRLPRIVRLLPFLFFTAYLGMHASLYSSNPIYQSSEQHRP